MPEPTTINEPSSSSQETTQEAVPVADFLNPPDWNSSELLEQHLGAQSEPVAEPVTPPAEEAPALEAEPAVTAPTIEPQAAAAEPTAATPPTNEQLQPSEEAQPWHTDPRFKDDLEHLKLVKDITKQFGSVEAYQAFLRNVDIEVANLANSTQQQAQTTQEATIHAQVKQLVDAGKISEDFADTYAKDLIEKENLKPLAHQGQQTERQQWIDRSVSSLLADPQYSNAEPELVRLVVANTPPGPAGLKLIEESHKLRSAPGQATPAATASTPAVPALTEAQKAAVIAEYNAKAEERAAAPVPMSANAPGVSTPAGSAARDHLNPPGWNEMTDYHLGLKRL